MIAKQECIEYLISTPFNYTCTNLAEHKPNLSHDVVSDFLAQQRFTPADLWAIVKAQVGRYRKTTDWETIYPGWSSMSRLNPGEYPAGLNILS